MAGAVGEHGVDHIAVLVAQLLGHVQHHAGAQVFQGDPARWRDRQPVTARLRGPLVMLTSTAAQKPLPPADTQGLTRGQPVNSFIH